jgi:hypothetical protein
MTAEPDGRDAEDAGKTLWNISCNWAAELELIFSLACSSETCTQHSRAHALRILASTAILQQVSAQGRTMQGLPPHEVILMYS